MSETLVTALVPVKDFHLPYLRKALASLLGQSCEHWRAVVVVEPRARLGVRKLLAEQLADDRIDLITNQGRKLAGAFNSGMRHAHTDFTAILLGDDMWAENAVEVLTGSIRRHPEVDFFHSSRLVIDGEDTPISSVHRSVAAFELDDFKVSSPVRHLLCWRLEKALAVGGMDETLNSVGPDDYDFPWTMAEQGARFMAVEECLYKYRDHRDCYRLTTHQTLVHHRREIARIMRKHGADEEEIQRKIDRAERTFLRQCLFKSRLDRICKVLRGFDAGDGWSETYG